MYEKEKAKNDLKKLKLKAGQTPESVFNKIEHEVRKAEDKKDEATRRLIDAGKLVEERLPNLNTYKGARSSYFVFHPKRFPNLKPNSLEVFDQALKLFYTQLHSWYDVCEIYQSEMTLSEGVTFKSLKKDIEKLIQAIIKDKEVYQIEALAEVLWDKDVDEKTQKHFIPSHTEIRKRGLEIRMEDSSIVVPNAFRIKKPLRRTWGG